MTRLITVIIIKPSCANVLKMNIMGMNVLERLIEVFKEVSNEIMVFDPHNVLDQIDIDGLRILGSLAELAISSSEYVIFVECNFVYEHGFKDVIMHALKHLRENNLSGLIIDSSTIVRKHTCVYVDGPYVKGFGRECTSIQCLSWTGILALNRDDLTLITKASGGDDLVHTLDSLIKKNTIKLTYYDAAGYGWWVLRNNIDKIIASYRLKLSIDRHRLSRKKIYIFDLDGTLICGNKPMPGAPELIKMIREMGVMYKILSNNSSITPDEIVKKLNDILFNGEYVVKRDNVYTSMDYFIDTLGTRIRNTTMYILLPRHVIKYYNLVHSPDRDYNDYDYVIVGFDTELTYEKLRKASLILQRNPRAKFILLHPDLRCPTDEGFIPDAGSIAKAISNASGREPDWIGGKPSIGMLEKAVGGFSKDEAIFFGDRLYTDLRMAVEAGVDFVLLLSGETRVSDINIDVVKREGVYVAKDFIEYATIVFRKPIGKIMY